VHVRLLRRSCPEYNQFYPLLGHEHSEQKYYTGDLLVLYMYYILSLINSTLLTAYMMCEKPVPYWWFSCHFLQKNIYSPYGPIPPLSHLTHCTPTAFNLYCDISFETDMREPAIYRLLTFHISNLMSIFPNLVRLSKESVQVQGLFWRFVTSLFLGWGIVNRRPNPTCSTLPCQLSVTAYLACSELPSKSGGHLHPQPEDAPCLDDKEPT
jgi:hypothetical protein